MQIVIEIHEVKPGVLKSTFYGQGRATPLEAKMVKHMVTSIDSAFKVFDSLNGKGFGGVQIKETDVKPDGGEGTCPTP